MKIIRQKRPEEWRVGMTIREAGKEIVTTGGGTYRIGFINTDGQEDETELDGFNLTELEELYRDFCKERMDSDRIL